MCAFLPFKSAPAQKALPVPVMMPTMKAGSESSHLQILSSSSLASVLRQLRSLGRLIRTSRTPSDGYERTVCLVGGTSFSKCDLKLMGAMVTFMLVRDSGNDRERYGWLESLLVDIEILEEEYWC